MRMNKRLNNQTFEKFS